MYSNSDPAQTTGIRVFSAASEDFNVNRPSHRVKIIMIVAEDLQHSTG